VIGLVILIGGLIYVALIVLVTRWAYRWAKGKGFSRGQCLGSAAFGFLVVYLPVFWDHVPTLVTYEYFCATEAGFWEYKTIDQWKMENPNTAGSLVSPKVAAFIRRGDKDNYADTHHINQRFDWIKKKSGPLAVNLWRWEEAVVDSMNGKVVASSIDFSTGDGSIGWATWPLKFWLKLGYCKGSGLYGGKLGSVVEAASNLGRGE